MFFRDTLEKRILTVLLILYAIASIYIFAASNCVSMRCPPSNSSPLVPSVLSSLTIPAQYLGMPFGYGLTFATQSDNLAVQIPLVIVAGILQLFIFYLVACTLVYLKDMVRRKKD